MNSIKEVTERAVVGVVFAGWVSFKALTRKMELVRQCPQEGLQRSWGWWFTQWGWGVGTTLWALYCLGAVVLGQGRAVGAALKRAAAHTAGDVGLGVLLISMAIYGHYRTIWAEAVGDPDAGAPTAHFAVPLLLVAVTCALVGSSPTMEEDKSPAIFQIF